MSILNVSSEDVKSQNSQGQGGGFQEDPNLFNPTHTKADNGVYEAVIRFIPFPEDPSKSEYLKRFTIFKHPLTNDRYIVDDPANEGYNSPLITLSIMLNKQYKNTEPEFVKRVQQYFQTSYTYISPVYVKKALYEEDIQDSIKFFKYKKTIHDLIEGQRESNPDLGIQGVEPFNLVHGKDFFVKVTKGEYGRNWEGCRFLDSPSAFQFKYNNKYIEIKDDEKHEQVYKKFFEKTAPDFNQYFHTPWTDEDYENVVNYLYEIVDYQVVLNKVLESAKDEKFKNLLRDKINKSHNGQHTVTEDVNTQNSSNEETVESNLSQDKDEPIIPSSDNTQDNSTENNEDEIDELLDNNNSNESNNDDAESEIDDILNS